MKVVLSVEALAPSLTGIGRYVWQLASRLGDHSEISGVHFFRNGAWIGNPAALLDPAIGRRTGWAKFRRRLVSRLPAWFTRRQLRMACRGRLFHGPNYFLPDCAEIGVATVHDLSIFKFPETHPAERLRHFERDFDRSMTRATRLITDSESTRRELAAFLGWPESRISAVHLGVSDDFAPRGESELAPRLNAHGLAPQGYVLCVSTLEPRKRIGDLLQAYRTLPDAIRRNFPLVLVGGAGWLSERLHEDIDRATAQGWLRYLGYVLEQDLPVLYAGASLFVYPSVYEGFGLPVVEAMASGVPVITSDQSSLPEVTQGAALLVSPGDIDGLAAAIARGIGDVSWRSEARARGLAAARSYSWERCVGNTIRVYQAAMAEGGYHGR